MAVKDRMAEWWATVPPERKRIILAVVLIGGVMGISALANKNRSTTPVVVQQKPKLDMSVVTAPRKDEGIQDLRTTVATLNSQLKNSNRQIETLTQQLSMLKETNQQQQNNQVSELTRELAAVRQEVRAYQSDALGGAPPSKVLPLPDLPPPEAVLPEKTANQPPPVKKPKLRIAGGDTAGITEGTAAKPPAAGGDGATKSARPREQAGSNDALRVASGNADVGDDLMQFIPAGTIINGTLLSGIDAPTSGMAQKQPVPALMRVGTLAFLPNRVTQDLRACHMILSGFGVLSSERAKLRTEVLSCIRNDGGVIETALDGFAVGPDGKEGLRGHLVTKQGSLIAKALFAGFISGFANVMRPTSVPSLNTSPGGNQSWQMPDVGNALNAGALTGIGGAANDVAKFFLETAREMHPVVEVPSETPVTIVLVKGATLAIGQRGKPTTSSGRRSIK